ncbi:MAG TPA: alkaline phosphatase family protein, partial [Actinophytocola sp.]|nr:alkaline phosphatase family protein [Actinophytocola sp.]
MRVRPGVVACLLVVGLISPTTAPTVAAPPDDSLAESTAAPETRVLVISVDGLNPAALRRLGARGSPHFHRLMAEGAFTLNARAQVEETTTLSNHTSMVTGRRIDRAHGGHGVIWNAHRRGTTVQKAAGHHVGSIFSVLHKAGMGVAMFAMKTRFTLFDRSWPGIDRVTIMDDQDGPLTNAVRADLIQHRRALTFLHLGGVDKAGHDDGFMSRAYLAAVRRMDHKLGMILGAIDGHEELDDLTIVLTADHGGQGPDHENPKKLVNFRVPFLVWGPGVAHDDLYDLNPAYQDPGRRRVGFGGKQPIRNGDVANFAAYLLGLGAV